MPRRGPRRRRRRALPLLRSPSRQLIDTRFTSAKGRADRVTTIPAPVDEKAADPSALKESLAARLAEARDRTLLLIEPLSDEQLNTVYSELLSPLAWDLGHIANFEELWLVQNLAGLEPLEGDLGRFYDAIENPRADRNDLPILRGGELRDYMARVRDRTLSVLESATLDDPSDRLAFEGFAHELILAHEHQHNETMLQLLQFVDGYEPGDRHPLPEPVAIDETEMVALAGGEIEIGAADAGFAYDNERPRHTIELDPFEIDRYPVTNGAYTAFIAETDAEPPLFWERDGEGGWARRRFGRLEELRPTAPVIHVDCNGAEAFARWAGKRLPTELEWEAAVAGADPDASNLDQLSFDVAPCGSLPASAADCGAEQMLGDVWEWTSSHFAGYPGFEAFPYPEYSEVFFGPDYRVLRGGAWAARRDVIRPSFRNWDYPIRRQIFAGLRCARSV